MMIKLYDQIGPFGNTVIERPLRAFSWTHIGYDAIIIYILTDYITKSLYFVT